jgi:hypothetical protein
VLVAPPLGVGDVESYLRRMGRRPPHVSTARACSMSVASAVARNATRLSRSARGRRLGAVDREGALEDEHGRPADDDALAAILADEDAAAS